MMSDDVVLLVSLIIDTLFNIKAREMFSRRRHNCPYEYDVVNYCHLLILILGTAIDSARSEYLVRTSASFLRKMTKLLE
jgi:hypothetical protein